jgi:hypothetical protein
MLTIISNRRESTMRAVLLIASLVAIGCGPGSSGSHQPIYTCIHGNSGIILLDWTIKGQPPSTMSCSGLTKITLDLRTDDCGEVEIDPIPCTLDKFLYEELPEGGGEVILYGIASDGSVKASGMARVTLGTTQPAAPTPVSMN